MKILIAEDDRLSRTFMAKFMADYGTCDVAVDGMEALDLYMDAGKKKDLAAIQVAGNRLFGQIGDILDYTEIDTGRIKISEDTYMISSLEIICRKERKCRNWYLILMQAYLLHFSEMKRRSKRFWSI